jgi:O-methyltransferase
MAMRKRLPVTSDEALDALAASRFGAALKPLTLLLNRNAELSLYSEQTRMLSLAFKYVESEGVVGDYAEFGVWMGRTFIEAWRVAAKYTVPRRFFAFDSFEGLPELDPDDQGGSFKAGQFKHSRAEFEARLRRARMPPSVTRIVEGRFEQTLLHPERIGLDHVAVAWVDCDLYASTVPVLDYLTPRLRQGSVLIFDDWFTFRASPEHGEMRACTEWLERNPELMLARWRPFHFAGQSFIVQRVPGAQ